MLVELTDAEARLVMGALSDKFTASQNDVEGGIWSRLMKKFRPQRQTIDPNTKGGKITT